MKFCTCDKCKECCGRMPGIPLPEEVVKIAEFLNMPVLECLKKYFIVGWRSGIEKIPEEVKFVYPARVGFNNQIEDWGYPLGTGPCVFFKNELCQINETKPFECLKAFGCDNKNGKKYPTLYIRDLVLLKWYKAHKNKTIHPDILKFISSIK